MEKYEDIHCDLGRATLDDPHLHSASTGRCRDLPYKGLLRQLPLLPRSHHLRQEASSITLRSSQVGTTQILSPWIRQLSKVKDRTAKLRGLFFCKTICVLCF